MTSTHCNRQRLRSSAPVAGRTNCVAKGTKSAPTPVCPTVGGDLRIVASPTERIERFKPVSLVSDEFVRDSLAVAHRTSYRRREEFDVRRRAALNRRKRLSDSLPR